MTPELARSNTITDMKPPPPATNNNVKVTGPSNTNTLNQLFALKDLSCYVANPSSQNKFAKKFLSRDG